MRESQKKFKKISSESWKKSLTKQREVYIDRTSHNVYFATLYMSVGVDW